MPASSFNTEHIGVAGTSSIVVDDVGKRFDDTWVLRGLNFEVDAGTITGLIGPSGCGKTTTVRMINGTYRPDEGVVRTLGAEPWDLSLRDRQRLGYLPQQPVLFDTLTLWENLNFHASLNGVRLRRRKVLLDALELVGLEGEQGKLVREASGGMQRRLALAATLLHRPDLIVLDEPTAGVDPILRSRLWEHFRHLAGEGTTVVVTTQYVGEAAHCDLVGLMTDGHLLHYATPDDLCQAAYGGEVFRITTARRLGDEELTEIGELPVVQTELTRDGISTITGVVADAGASIPTVLAWLHERDIEIVDSEEVAVDYEEVFVRLVERRTNGEGEAAIDKTAEVSVEEVPVA